MTRRWITSLLQLTLVATMLSVLLACVWRTEHKIETVHKIDAHIVLDIRQIRQEAAQVEDYVRGEAATLPAPATPDEADGKPVSAVIPRRSMWALLDPAGATWAADDDKGEVSAAEEKAAIEARRARFRQIDEALTKGLLGENDRGYIEARGKAKEDKSLETLARAENRDRKTIYRAIVRRRSEKRLDLSVVELIMAEEIRSKLKKEQFFQAPRDRAAFGAFAESKLGRAYPDAKPGQWLQKK